MIGCVNPAPQQPSAPEVEFARAATARGYRFESEYPVAGGRYRLDFALPRERVGVEIDGFIHHGTQDAFVRDRKRQRAIEYTGWRVLRFAAQEVLTDPHGCLREVIEFAGMSWTDTSVHDPDGGRPQPSVPPGAYTRDHSKALRPIGYVQSQCGNCDTEGVRVLVQSGSRRLVVCSGCLSLRSTSLLPFGPSSVDPDLRVAPGDFPFNCPACGNFDVSGLLLIRYGTERHTLCPYCLDIRPLDLQAPASDRPPPGIQE